MAAFNILYGNYYHLHGEFELICIGKFSRRTWVNFTQQYGKNRQRCQQNKFTMLHDNYCYIFIENFPQKFSPCVQRVNSVKISVELTNFWHLRYFTECSIIEIQSTPWDVNSCLCYCKSVICPYCQFDFSFLSSIAFFSTRGTEQ